MYCLTKLITIAYANLTQLQYQGSSEMNSSFINLWLIILFTLRPHKAYNVLKCLCPDSLSVFVMLKGFSFWASLQIEPHIYPGKMPVGVLSPSVDEIHLLQKFQSHKTIHPSPHSFQTCHFQMCSQEGQISCHDVPIVLRLLICKEIDNGKESTTRKHCCIAPIKLSIYKSIYSRNVSEEKRKPTQWAPALPHEIQYSRRSQQVCQQVLAFPISHEWHQRRPWTALPSHQNEKETQRGNHQLPQVALALFPGHHLP